MKKKEQDLNQTSMRTCSMLIFMGVFAKFVAETWAWWHETTGIFWSFAVGTAACSVSREFVVSLANG